MTSLSQQAAKINELNRQLGDSMGQSLSIAAQIRQELNVVKLQLPHGDFRAWLESNCAVEKSQANTFMRLAAGFPELSNVHRAGHLPSIREMLALLTAAPDKKAEIVNRLQSGEKIPPAEIAAIGRSAKAAKPPPVIVDGEFTEERRPTRTETPLQPPCDDKIIRLQEYIHELETVNSQIQADIDSMGKVFDSDDRLATAVKEASECRRIIAGLELRIHGMQAEKNEAIKSVRYWKARAEKSEKAAPKAVEPPG
jgi:Protein of unknown function (DUF3102)